VDEFLRFVRDGGPTLTTPVGARYAVAAGYAATMSLRAGGGPVDVVPLDPALEGYFSQTMAGNESGRPPTATPTPILEVP
jgi:hypothetical protein